MAHASQRVPNSNKNTAKINRTLNARGNRFEVIYRSYEPIDGSYVDLIAHENNSVYYKNNQGMRTAWLNCREG